VFLIALPLCLGISTASGFPPVSGILTAIIGGIVVGPITGSTLSIKGPAAGLIAIAAAAVLELGEGDPMAGYRCTLAVIAVSGLVQVLFGALRLGRFTDFFPGAAVHGMLASIGIIIVAKQLPVLLGTHAVATSPLAMLAEAPEMLGRLNPEITLIGTLSLAVLFGFPFIKNRYIKMVPVPILVLAVGVALGYFFHLEQAQVDLLLNQSYPSGPGFLITLPDRFADGFVLPDLSKLFTLTSLKYIAMFAIVGSLESLLTVKAVEGLDPWKRRSDANRDLAAIGAGNAIAGSIGGLPMIAEVVQPM
jgi:MFS superfamily sulfate permease-like transporter